jgi:hypothetical protein
MFDRLVNSYEDEAPVAYALKEGEPLVSPVMTPVLTPGKSGDLAPMPQTHEWIGSAMGQHADLPETLEVKVWVTEGGQVCLAPLTFSLEEAITLACTLMDACHFIVRRPHRDRVEAELAALHRECEEAPVC